MLPGHVVLWREVEQPSGQPRRFRVFAEEEDSRERNIVPLADLEALGANWGWRPALTLPVQYNTSDYAGHAAKRARRKWLLNDAPRELREAYRLLRPVDRELDFE